MRRINANVNNYVLTTTGSHIVCFICGCSLYHAPLTILARRWTSESDVCRRQILTFKDRPRAEELKNYNGRRPITY